MTTITVPRELLEQALKALAYHTVQTHPIVISAEAILSLRAALAAPQVEPWTSLHLGKFAIGMHLGKLSIAHDSGESGQFDAGKFEACVARFFKEHF